MLTSPWRVVLTSTAGALVVLATLVAGGQHAAAQITGLTVDNTQSSGSVSLGTGENICTTSILGTIAPLGGNVGESRNTVSVTASTPTSFTTRFIADLCTDSGGSTVSSVLVFSCSPGGNSQSLTANYNLNFGVIAPVGTPYRLTITDSIAGAVDVNADGGSNLLATGTMSNITTTESPAVLFGGGGLGLNTSVNFTPGGTAESILSGTATAQYVGTGTGGALATVVNSNWNASCSSQTSGWECGIRIGLPCTITGGAALVGDTSFGPGGLYPGSPVRTQATDGQFITVGLAFCGDGTIQQDGVLSEACDNGLDPVTGNGGSASCCNTNCTVKTSGTTCRVAAGECDAIETCDGVNPACPADLKKAAGTPCTDDGNPCSADICNGDGVTNTCTHPPGNPGTLCRASIDSQCDPAEFCTGLSTTCPADVRQPTGFLCSSDGNPCTADICNNTSGTCTHPAGNAGSVCRAATDTCDVAETCTGTSTACPPDGVAAAGTVCPDDGKACTVDQCDGTSKACQHPAANAGSLCRPAVDIFCDRDEFCTGTNPNCPPDLVVAAGITCRPAAGPCDVEEACTGTSGYCPPDAFLPNTVVCRPTGATCDGGTNAGNLCSHDSDCPGSTCAAGTPNVVCDVPETCTGTAANCPVDGVAVAGTVCRAATDVCDVAETCDGTSKACPPDQLAPPFVVCRDAVPAPTPSLLDPSPGTTCDLPEYCTGTYAGCPFDQKLDGSAVCRPVALICSSGTNDGNPCSTDSDCPGGTCPPVSCDAAEYCDGVNNACPTDQFAPANTVCRPEAGFCDVPESCTGTSSTCPADLFKTGDLCRDVVGVCDAAEHCSGSSALCPPDGFQPSTLLCRPVGTNASVDCDIAEYCSGTGALCPLDLFVPNGTQCDGTDPNTCMNACVTGLCTADTPVTRTGCCGNGILDPGEQCDDGNQLDGDLCPSLPGDDCRFNNPALRCQSGPNANASCTTSADCSGAPCVATGYLISGDNHNPATDTRGCQVEFSVLNPNAPMNKWGTPSNVQVCQDQDPSCDLDPRPGRCRFHVVVCLNNTDPNLPVCLPLGVNSLVINSRPYVSKSSPQITLVGLNLGKLSHAVQQLFDPANAGAGFGTAPPLTNAQQNLCSGGMLIDVFAGSSVVNESKVISQRFMIQSKNNHLPRAMTDTANLYLECKALPVPN